ncbi:MAG: UDP-N-acetylglucosamine--N-acetylmuramyl-(pentapeptide) pyrophosphoryl-undecaprenol N-acetylglucosamine transferase, partial [Kiritimatiellae bacterium]|nr:UDP-N-acetylglucosamine--N-acetylmuramyl-(pentapeptide) pyrophosphoryl-undecaprenol N-acetylglucosamine transferase [Kiritimatiellia bacterium]
ASVATILVTGGSQGAYEMNRRVAEALATLSARPGTPRFRVIHQTGSWRDAEEATRARYASASVEALVTPFIAEMGGAYKAADLVVARAGAATCAEIALFGKPSLLIPLPTAVRDHQFLNAKYLADAGAAAVMRQETCEPKALADAIGALLAAPSRLAEMSRAALSLASPDAATKLAEVLEQL